MVSQGAEAMMRMTEENGARKAVLRQAAFFPEEGITYEAFLKVLIPQQQAAGRKLLQEGYLTRSSKGGIALSPLVRRNALQKTAWGENIRAFLVRLITSLAEAVTNYWKTQEWAEQAKSDPDRLRALVFQCSRDTTLSPLEARLAEEAKLLFTGNEARVTVAGSKRVFLIDATIGIELKRNLESLRNQASLIAPTLENVLSQVDDIPEQHLLRAYDWLSEVYLILENRKKAEVYLDRWRLLKAASGPSFEVVERALGDLFDPHAGDQTVGAMLKRRKEHHNE